MASQSTQSEVELCPVVARPHVYIKDEEDKRFKTCKFCGRSEYRTDEEVMGNAETR